MTFGEGEVVDLDVTLDIPADADDVDMEQITLIRGTVDARDVQLQWNTSDMSAGQYQAIVEAVAGDSSVADETVIDIQSYTSNFDANLYASDDDAYIYQVQTSDMSGTNTNIDSSNKSADTLFNSNDHLYVGVGDTLYKLDGETLDEISSVTFGGDVDDGAWDGNWLYVGVGSDVLQVDPSSLAVEATYSVVSSRSGVISAGEYIYVAEEGSDRVVTQVDPSDMSEVAVFSSSMGGSDDRALTWDGEYIYAVADGDMAVFKIDPSGMSQAAVYDGGSDYGGYVAATFDGDWVVVARWDELYRFDPDTLDLMDSGGPLSVAVNDMGTDGDYIYVEDSRNDAIAKIEPLGLSLVDSYQTRNTTLNGITTPVAKPVPDAVQDGLVAFNQFEGGDGAVGYNARDGSEVFSKSLSGDECGKDIDVDREYAVYTEEYEDAYLYNWKDDSVVSRLSTSYDGSDQRCAIEGAYAAYSRGSYDVYAFEVPSGSRLYRLDNRERTVVDVSIVNGRLGWADGGDFELAVHDVSDGTLLQKWGNGYNIRASDISESYAVWATDTRDSKNAYIQNIAGGSLEFTITPDSTEEAVGIAITDNYVAIGMSNGDGYVYDVPSGSKVHTFTVDRKPFAVDLSDPYLLYGGDYGGGAYLVDLSDGSRVETYSLDSLVSRCALTDKLNRQ